MSFGFILLVCSAVAAWWIAGARSFAYLVYYLCFVPFVTLDLTDGGLQAVGDFTSDHVLLKMAVRLGTAALVVLLLARRRRAFGVLADPRVAPAVFLVVWASLGLFEAREPLVPVFRLGELAVFVLAGAVLWSDSIRGAPLRSVLRWHALALLPLVAITLAYLAIHPELAVHVGADGMVRMGNRLLNAETLGTTGAVLVLWGTYELKEPRAHTEAWWRERAVPALCLAVAVAVLLLARSRTAMIATIIGQLVLWSPLFGATRRQWLSSAAFFALVLVFAALNPDEIERWFLRGEGVANLRSGTGRTELWAHLLDEAVPARPILGNGYLHLSAEGGFWHAGTNWTNAHNAYLGALLYAGIPGLLAVLAILALPIKNAFRRARDAGRGAAERSAWTLVLAFASLAAISSATSFGVCGWPNPLMLFFYALYPLAVCGPRALPDRDETRDELVPHRSPRAHVRHRPATEGT